MSIRVIRAMMRMTRLMGRVMGASQLVRVAVAMPPTLITIMIETITGRIAYPGLRPFTRDEFDLFFGRENCVDQMVDTLAASRFLAASSRQIASVRPDSSSCSSIPMRTFRAVSTG